MTDAPAHRIWPPVALGGPLLAAVMLTATAGDPFALAPDNARVVGATLIAVVIWNGWTLIVMAANRTAVLSGGATRALLDRWPFRLSRNPLYSG